VGAVPARTVPHLCSTEATNGVVADRVGEVGGGGGGRGAWGDDFFSFWVGSLLFSSFCPSSSALPSLWGSARKEIPNEMWWAVKRV